MPETGGDDDWISEALAEGLFERVDAPPPTHREQPPTVAPEALAPATVPTTTPPVTVPTPHRPADAADVTDVAPERTPTSPVAVFDQDIERPDAEFGLQASHTDLPNTELSNTELSNTALSNTALSDADVSDADLLTRRDDEIDSSSDAVESTEQADEPDQMASFAKAVGEWIVVLVGAIAVALILRALLFQAFFIPSESMESTLLEDDRVLVNKVSYDLGEINQGDVVVFRRPDDEPGEIRDLIKRVIGVPGQTVEGRNNAVWINGNRLEESYLADDEVILDFGPITVEEGQLFVMGDNRDESLDSRFFGPIDEERVVGRAFVIFWPLNRIAWL